MIDRYQPVWIQRSSGKLRLFWIPYDPPRFWSADSAEPNG
jgi:hypothetical protein